MVQLRPYQKQKIKEIDEKCKKLKDEVKEIQKEINKINGEISTIAMEIDRIEELKLSRIDKSKMELSDVPQYKYKGYWMRE